jgi:hypothetical protein
MDRKVIVEVINRQEKVIRRTVTKDLPATIGRSYENDIIIDDPYVNRSHCRIVQNDEKELYLIDCGSENGILNSGKRNETVKIPTINGLNVILGKTVIRLRTSDFLCQPVKPLRITREPSSLFNIHIKNHVMFLLFTALYLGMRTFLLTTSDYLESGLPLFFAILVGGGFWCTGWAFLNRVLSDQFNFFLHISLLCVVGLFLDLCLISISYLSFLVQLDTFVKILILTVCTITMIGLLYSHLSLLGSLKLYGRLIACGISFVLIVASYSFSFYHDQKRFSPYTSFNNELKPLSTYLIPTTSKIAFFDKSKSLIFKLKAEEKNILITKSKSNQASSN